MAYPSLPRLYARTCAPVLAKKHKPNSASAHVWPVVPCFLLQSTCHAKCLDLLSNKGPPPWWDVWPVMLSPANPRHANSLHLLYRTRAPTMVGCLACYASSCKAHATKIAFTFFLPEVRFLIRPSIRIGSEGAMAVAHLRYLPLLLCHDWHLLPQVVHLFA